MAFLPFWDNSMTKATSGTELVLAYGSGLMRLHHGSKGAGLVEGTRNWEIASSSQTCRHEMDRMNWKCNEAVHSQIPIEVTSFPPQQDCTVSRKSVTSRGPVFKYPSLWKAFLIQTITIVDVFYVCVWDKMANFKFINILFYLLNATVSHIVYSEFLSHWTDFCN